MPLNETLQTVWDAHKLYKAWKDIEEFLTAKGYPMPKSTFYRKLGTVKAKRREQLYDIAKNYAEGTADRINTFHTLESKLFDILEKTTDNMVKVRVIKEIKELQYDITAFEESTQGTIQTDVKLFGDQESRDEEILSQAASIGRRQNPSKETRES